jgi:thioredoxin reductase (NADPH)
MAKPILVIVDENEDLLNQIQRDLERKYGSSYQVITASSGHEALMMLRRWREEGQRVAVVVADRRAARYGWARIFEAGTGLIPRC